MDTTNEIRPFREIRAAFADAGPQRDNDAYVHGMRCLSFLTSSWLSPDEAKEAATFIKAYNHFDADSVAAMVEDIEMKDDTARFAFGREKSPAIYVETEVPDAVESVFESYGPARPDELSKVEPGGVGSNRKDLYGDGEDQMDPHLSCSHDEPPVPTEEYAPTSDDKSYVRGWWD